MILSRSEVSNEVFDRIKTRERIARYEGANHSVAEASSVANGENPRIYLADGLVKRLQGKALTSVKGFVNSAGRRTDTPA